MAGAGVIYLARIKIRLDPQFEGDTVRCYPMNGGLMPRALWAVYEQDWGVRWYLLKTWAKV